MTAKLSNAELSALLAGITPGPWQSHKLMATGEFGICGRIDPLGKAYRINDARAIAQVPALLAEVLALREALRGFVYAEDNRADMPSDIDAVNLARARAALKGSA